MEVTNELFEKYRRISPDLVRNYFHIKDKLLEDILVSAGYEGILNALKNYSIDRNVPLYSFARICAYRSILYEFNKQLSIRKKTIPLSLFQRTYKKHYSQTEFQDKFIDGEIDDWMKIDIETDILERIVEDEYNKFLIKRASEVISKLSDRNRDIVYSYINGESQRSIAKRNNVSAQAISSFLKAFSKKISIEKLDNQYNEV
jgi:RNA polymerase sigma factor (sigma-70 family)